MNMQTEDVHLSTVYDAAARGGLEEDSKFETEQQRKQKWREEYPPGVELEGVGFNTEAVFAWGGAC